MQNLNKLKLHKCFHIISCSQLFSSTVLKLSCTTLAPYYWCAKVSSFQQVWKAKRWESKCMKVMLSASPSYYLAIRAHTSTVHHFTAQWDQIEINFQSDNGISIALIHEIWKAKRWESKCMRVMLSAKPFLLLSYMRPPLLCTILMHSGIKLRSIFNQVMASKLFWFKNLKKTARVLKHIELY